MDLFSLLLARQLSRRARPRYETEEKELFTLVQSLIQDEVNTLLPSWVGEGQLKRLGSKSLPEVKKIRAHSDTVHCEEGIVLTR